MRFGFLSFTCVAPENAWIVERQAWFVQWKSRHGHAMHSPRLAVRLCESNLSAQRILILNNGSPDSFCCFMKKLCWSGKR